MVGRKEAEALIVHWYTDNLGSQMWEYPSLWLLDLWQLSHSVNMSPVVSFILGVLLYKQTEPKDSRMSRNRDQTQTNPMLFLEVFFLTMLYLTYFTDLFFFMFFLYKSFAFTFWFLILILRVSLCQTCAVRCLNVFFILFIWLIFFCLFYSLLIRFYFILFYYLKSLYVL